MKEFFNPTMEIVLLNANDVITTSIAGCQYYPWQDCTVHCPSEQSNSKGW